MKVKLLRRGHASKVVQTSAFKVVEVCNDELWFDDVLMAEMVEADTEWMLTEEGQDLLGDHHPKPCYSIEVEMEVKE